MKRAADELLQSEQSVYQTVCFPGGCTSFLGSSEAFFRCGKSGISIGTCEQTEPEQLKRRIKEKHAAAPVGESTFLCYGKQLQKEALTGLCPGAVLLRVVSVQVFGFPRFGVRPVGAFNQSDRLLQSISDGCLKVSQVLQGLIEQDCLLSVLASQTFFFSSGGNLRMFDSLPENLQFIQVTTRYFITPSLWKGSLSCK